MTACWCGFLFDRLSSKNRWNMVKPGDFHLRVSKDFQKAYLPMRSTTPLPFPLRRTQHSWWCEENGKTQKTLTESWRVSYLKESFWCFFPTVIIFQSNFWILEISKSILQKKISSGPAKKCWGSSSMPPSTTATEKIPKSSKIRRNIMLTVLQTLSTWFPTWMIQVSGSEPYNGATWYILCHTRRHISSNGSPSGKPTWATRCACGSSKPLKLRSISRSSPVLRKLEDLLEIYMTNVRTTCILTYICNMCIYIHANILCLHTYVICIYL